MLQPVSGLEAPPAMVMRTTRNNTIIAWSSIRAPRWRGARWQSRARPRGCVCPLCLFTSRRDSRGAHSLSIFADTEYFFALVLILVRSLVPIFL